ncbi:MAG: zf-HC2 domain-containing protein [Clostridia bacterium]|nr:zf-HC2 domain-containing protein [Clostridia bacterium]
MKTECEVIRDLLPLYADEVCSEKSRGLVEEHLAECPECKAVLRELMRDDIESGLKDEKDGVIAHQAIRFKRRSAAVGSLIAGLFMIPVLVCLIVNLASGHGLDWFFVVLAALGVTASLTVVPLTVAEDKLFWTFCAFCVTLTVLLGVCSLYSGGKWFLTAASASLFGLALIFLPFAVRSRPIKRLIGSFSRPVVILAADLILFANMMNMITLRSKSVFVTVVMLILCAAGGYLLFAAVKAGRNSA